jgi:hypothetical protein
MDNVYLHPGPFNKERIKKERGEDVCTLHRLQGAFDKVDREKMFECMRETERNKRIAGTED